MLQPFYNPEKTYQENYDEGPFGLFSDGQKDNDLGEPQFKFLGFEVNLPFGIPAGPLLNGKYIKAALDKGFDIPIHKTVRTRYYPCHPWPNVLGVEIDGDLTLEKASQPLIAKHNYKEPLSITNSFGNPSKDPCVWQKDIADCVAYAKRGQIVGASTEGTHWENFNEEQYINDWVKGASLIKEAGAHFIEANLSCPNEGTTSLVCFDVKKSRIIAEAIKNKIGDMPLLLKTAYFADENNLREFVKELGNIVDGISVINTISAEVVDEKGNQALPGGAKRKRSGVCGHSIRWAGLEMTRRLKKLRQEFKMKFAIIGGGGVITPDDYQKYCQAGAEAVMSATGAMWNPFLAREIKKSLKKVPCSTQDIS